MIDYDLLNKALFWIKIYYEIRVLRMVYDLFNNFLDKMAEGVMVFVKWRENK